MADVPSALKDWSATASSNSPSDATAIGAGLADNLQALQAVVRGDLATKGSDIASSASPDVAAVQGLYHDLTGNSTVTGLGSGSAGIWKVLQFDSTPQLTHSTALALPGAANITAAAGDVGIFFCEATNVWRCISYFKVSGYSVNREAAASDTVAGVIEYAVQSEMETGTSNVLAVTPGRQHYHASAAKFWVAADSAGTINLSYNVTSVTDVGTGVIDVTIATDFSGASWVFVQGNRQADDSFRHTQINTQAAGSIRAKCEDAGGSLADPTEYYFAAFGDQ